MLFFTSSLVDSQVHGSSMSPEASAGPTEHVSPGEALVRVWRLPAGWGLRRTAELFLGVDVFSDPLWIILTEFWPPPPHSSPPRPRIVMSEGPRPLAPWAVRNRSSCPWERCLLGVSLLTKFSNSGGKCSWILRLFFGCGPFKVFIEFVTILPLVFMFLFMATRHVG